MDIIKGLLLLVVAGLLGYALAYLFVHYVIPSSGNIIWWHKVNDVDNLNKLYALLFGIALGILAVIALSIEDNKDDDK